MCNCYASFFTVKSQPSLDIGILRFYRFPQSGAYLTCRIGPVIASIGPGKLNDKEIFALKNMSFCNAYDVYLTDIFRIMCQKCSKNEATIIARIVAWFLRSQYFSGWGLLASCLFSLTNHSFQNQLIADLGYPIQWRSMIRQKHFLFSCIYRFLKHILFL